MIKVRAGRKQRMAGCPATRCIIIQIVLLSAKVVKANIFFRDAHVVQHLQHG